MTFGLAYWICMLIWLALGVYQHRASLPAGGGDLLLFILLVLSGWKVFGPPIHS